MGDFQETQMPMFVDAMIYWREAIVQMRRDVVRDGYLIIRVIEMDFRRLHMNTIEDQSTCFDAKEHDDEFWIHRFLRNGRKTVGTVF